MKVLVFGAGALGSLLGAFLARRHEVHLVARRPHAEAIRRDGLRIDGLEALRPRLQAHEEAPAVPFDLVLVTVKAFDTASAGAAVKKSVGERTTVVTAQNGLGNWETLSRLFPKTTVLAAPAYYGALLEAPGRVRYSGPGRILLGGEPRHAAAIEALVRDWNGCGLQASVAADIRAALWLKATVNAAINALTAMHRVENGRLLQDPALRERMRRITLECGAVAAAAGIRLPVPDLVAEVERVARETATNRSSMLQSLERGQRTEIDSINGEIIREGNARGLECPENEAVLAAVKALRP